MDGPYFAGNALLHFAREPEMTPMLLALFGAMEPRMQERPARTVSVVLSDELLRWSAVVPGVASYLGISGNEPDPAHVLQRLAARHGPRAAALVKTIVDAWDERSDAADEVGTQDLFDIAQACNDGHTLSAIASLGAWVSLDARNSGNCGAACFSSERVHLELAGDFATSLGSQLNAWLCTGGALHAWSGGQAIDALIGGAARSSADKAALRKMVATHLLNLGGTDLDEHSVR